MWRCHETRQVRRVTSGGQNVLLSFHKYNGWWYHANMAPLYLGLATLVSVYDFVAFVALVSYSKLHLYPQVKSWRWLSRHRSDYFCKVDGVGANQMCQTKTVLHPHLPILSPVQRTCEIYSFQCSFNQWGEKIGEALFLALVDFGWIKAKAAVRLALLYPSINPGGELSLDSEHEGQCSF